MHCRGLEKLLVSVASLLSEPRVEHGLNDEAARGNLTLDRC